MSLHQQIIEVTLQSPHEPAMTRPQRYTFSSNEVGTIAYGGSCSSDPPLQPPLTDNNTITFRKPSGGGLDEGTYSNCTISGLLTMDSNTSDNLSVSSFTIDTTATNTETRSRRVTNTNQMTTHP